MKARRDGRIRMDMHVHSIHSPDGLVRPTEILKAARGRGLGGLAVVDHNSAKGGIYTARRVAEDPTRYRDFIVVRGVEVSTADGHLMGLGITRVPPKGLPAEETAEAIRDLGGIVVVPHYGRHVSGIRDEGLVRRIAPEGMEVINRKSHRRHNQRAEMLADSVGAGHTAGSDSHGMRFLGTAYTIVGRGDAGSEDDVIQAIVKRRTRAGGRGATLSESFRKVMTSGWRWMRRGGKRV